MQTEKRIGQNFLPEPLSVHKKALHHFTFEFTRSCCICGVFLSFSSVNHDFSLFIINEPDFAYPCLVIHLPLLPQVIILRPWKENFHETISAAPSSSLSLSISKLSFLTNRSRGMDNKRAVKKVRFCVLIGKLVVFLFAKKSYTTPSSS